ncbi:MAG: RNA polymerase sigma factor [Acidimicrobiia bacterium]
MERSDDSGRHQGMDLPLPVLGSLRDDRSAWAVPPPPEGGGAAPAEPARAREVAELVTVDGVAFAGFYRRTRPSVARALALSLGDADLAAEATDEAMARAYERWPAVSGYDRPEAWVYRVASNWARSVVRRRLRSPHRFYEPREPDNAVVGDPAVDAALAELSVDHRSVVVCRYLLGWPVADIATALGVREGTVKSRLHRATQLLQTRLDHLRPREQQP